MALTWTLSLRDGMSATASRCAASLRKVEGALRGTDKGTNKTEKAVDKAAASVRGAGADADKTSGRMGRLSRVVRSLGNAFGAMGSKATGAARGVAGAMGIRTAGMSKDQKKAAGERGEAIRGALGTVGGVGVAAATATLGGAVAGALHIREAQAFAESTKFAFETLLKSKDAANKAFKLGADTSVAIGSDFKESMTGMTSLLAQGFDPKFADTLIRRMADIKALNPAANMEGMVRAIAQIKATGRLQGDELMQLTEAGVPAEKVYQNIAKSLGIVEKKGVSAVEQVQKLQEAGKIKADVAIGGIMAALAETTGGGAAGAVATKKADNSLEGTIARALNLKDQMLATIQIDWSPIVNAIKSVMDALKSEKGAKLLTTIGKGFDQVMAAFTKQDAGKMIDMMIVSLQLFFDVLTMSIPTLEVLTGALFLVGTGATVAWGALMLIANAIGGALMSAWNFVSKIEWSSLGTAVIDGIVGGITAGTAAVINAITGVGTSAIEAAESVFGIGSPSKVFEYIYSMTNAGAVRGTERTAPKVAAATAGTAATAANSAARAGAVGMMAGQSIRNSTSNDNSRSITIASMNIHAGAGADGASLGRGIRNELRQVVAQNG